MTDIQEILSRILHSGRLLEINFYQINDNFFELMEEGFWIIDGGVELKFPGGIVSASWDSELETYVIKNDSVKNIYNQDNLFQLESENIKGLKKFVGLNVSGLNFKSLEFEYLIDHTMRTAKEQRYVELIIDFENKSQLQIAFVDFMLEENEPPKEFSFDLNTNLLVSTKSVLEIKT